MVDEDKVITNKLLELRQKTGYEIIEKNGHRQFGPCPNSIGPPPPKGCEVFVGKLPRQIFEDELVPIFSRMGKVYEMRLMMDFGGSNRGYAFVTYMRREEAAAAIRELNGFEIRPGRPIEVVKSVDNCRLFCGGIPQTKTKEEVYQELSKKVAGIVDVILYKNNFDSTKNRGFAIVDFTSHHAAAMAREALLWDHEVILDWAEPEPDIDDELMKKHEHVYKEDEGISSGCPADSICGLPGEATSSYQSMAQNNNYRLAPAKLDAMCKTYSWAAPSYIYQQFVDPTGTLKWVCHIELSQVGRPLLSVPSPLGPFVTQACFDTAQARVQAAETALKHIKALLINNNNLAAAPLPLFIAPRRRSPRCPRWRPATLAPAPASTRCSQCPRWHIATAPPSPCQYPLYSGPPAPPAPLYHIWDNMRS